VNPPFHHPVFVLTRHPRASITMQGGTTFHFVDDGIEAALERAFNAAGGADVRIVYRVPCTARRVPRAVYRAPGQRACKTSGQP
jgi:hypothetical protein